MVKKSLKLPRALKLKRRNRLRVPRPLPNEDPIVLLRVQAIGCKGLLAKDRGGTSDPFIHITLSATRFTTPVIKKTLTPTWSEGSATFDFPIYLSTSDSLGHLELVIWDKDVIKKDYLGEVSVGVADWFGAKQERAFGFNDPGNTPFTIPVLSTRSNTASQGTITLKLGFVQPPNIHVLSDFDETYGELVKRGRRSLVSAPPTEGVGTIRSYSGVPAMGDEYEDDGGISSDSDSEDSDDEADEDEAFVDAPDELDVLTPTGGSTPATSLHDATTPTPTSVNANGVPASPKTPGLAVTPPSPSLSSPATSLTTTAGSKPKSPTFMRMKFPRRNTGGSVSSSPESPGEEEAEKKKLGFRKSLPSPSLSRKGTIPTAAPGTATPSKKERRKKPYSISGPNDIVGIVMLEIKCAEDLPRLKNMTRTGWDMDPFVIISFGKKVFRTRVIRHSRNPVWEEKLLFHVRRYETNFKIQLTVLDWDKLSSNDLIGEGNLEVAELISQSSGDLAEGSAVKHKGVQPPTAKEGSGEDEEMKEFKVPIKTGGSAAPWEALHTPILTVRAKYQPYAELRKKFWTQYLKQYDTDDTGKISHIEMTSMLDSLGSTLTRRTIDMWWERLGKDPRTDELTVGEAVVCLEEELGRPESERQIVGPEGGAEEDTSVSATPLISMTGSNGQDIKLEEMDFSGPPMSLLAGGEKHETEPMQQHLPGQDHLQSDATPPPPSPGRRNPSYSSSDDADEDEEDMESSSSALATDEKKGKKKIKGRFKRKGKNNKDSASSSSSASGASTGPSVERVINVKNCPMCHRPRLNSKAEVDIITHLAVCASSDWSKVGSISVSNYVTGAQAQRKWYTKIIGRIGGGDYRLGANSANIIVQDRITGGLQEEKMAVYVRLGIRLLYKGASRGMEGGGARRLLKSMSIKQGVKYDSPESARDIPAFIQFHGLDVSEILDPLDSFKNFNQFFYRKLKPEARPIESPDDPFRLVSAADCRLMVFESVSEATRLWIKGRDFTVSKLLGDSYKADWARYDGGAVAIFRLAPQDYHRFHSSVNGTIGKMEYISGEYYTVNPQAIRTSLDVYGDNARKIVPMDSPQFGRVMAVCVGAMMVGTIRTTVDEGEEVKRGQEFGYFAFGGSTIVMLFEPGKVEWDEDLLVNGRASLETLVRVGMGIGRGSA